MAFFPSDNAPGIFSQGSFINTGNETPETIARKRAQIAAMMPRFGQARYIGEGLGQLFMGIGSGRQQAALDQAETAGRQGAADRFAAIFNGRAQPGGFSILGQMPADPASPQGIANDTMAALGKGPDFAALEQQYGLPQGYLSRTAQIESGGNPNAQNPNSSAGGMFQFIDSTANQYGLTNKFDPMASADAAARLARDNRAVLLQALGREPTAGELYLAHQQGAGGAAQLLKAGNAPAASVVGADAARLNGGGGMSAADFANQWTGRFDGTTPVSGGGAPSADINQLYALAMDPWQPQEVKALAMSMIQQQQQASDPLRQMELQRAQLELEALRNPGRETQFVKGVGLIDSATGEVINDFGGAAAETDIPSSFAALDMQAQAAGLQKGTPEYQEFMMNGGGSGAPATFIALDMQANAAGFDDGTPEYKQFMATRGAGLSAEASAMGKAAGEATASAPTQISNGEIALQGIDEIRKHPGLDRGTGMTSMGNWVPGTEGYAFQTRVQQLAGGAFLTAIQQMQGMGALSNSEGQTATAALARLNTGLSRKEFEDALADYESIVKKGMERAQAKLAPAAQPQNPPQQGGATMRYNPATGKIEPVGGN